MKKERSDKLWKLYESGMTTIEEEKELSKMYEGTDGSSWFDYIKNIKKDAPANLEDNIWNVIKSERRKKRTLSFRYASIAATILLLVSLFVFNPLSDKQMSKTDKETVLAEAYALIGDSEQETGSKEIIYEDDILVLYTE